MPTNEVELPNGELADPFQLVVNGVTREVAADPDTPLLYAIRNDLGLRGTMFGCGVGLCGACFVLIDDQAVPSCDTPLWAAAGKSITTIEGLAVDGLTRLQQSFIDEQAGQCGYCLAGMLISATALLKRNSSPTRQEVLEVLDRNLCRCGSQTRIVEAVLNATVRPEN